MKLSVQPGSRYVGVLAAYRDLPESNWRVVIPLQEQERNSSVLSLDALGIKAQDDASKEEDKAMAMHKVVWQEGMLLRPQHFQQNDRYHDYQLKTRTQKLDSYSWGFFELEIDRQFLNMGKLVVSKASGILPDGTLFDIGAEREPLALDVPPNTGNTPVYLALPLVTGNHIESRRPEQQDVLARFTAFDEEIADSNAGDSASSQVSCGRPDFRLLLGEQQSDQAYVKLQLCDVLDTTPDGVISIDPEFIPTYVNFQASGYLLSCLKEVISMLAHRGDILAERIRATGKVGGAEVG